MKKLFTEKLWRVMKISLVQGIIAITISGIAIAHDNKAQLLERKVTIAVHEQTLETALKQIGLQANVTFVYSTSHLDPGAIVSIESKDQDLGELLTKLLGPLDISFKVYDEEESITLKQSRSGNKTIIPLDDGPASKDPTKLRFVVTGLVKDASSGLPLAGVNVIVRGTTNGTSTDREGKYSIEAEPSDILVFSFIGFKSRELAIANQTTLDVDLDEDVSPLNEVIVHAGYWDVKQKEQTGNIGSISFKEIKEASISNPIQALQGRMAGVYVQQTTGLAGGGFNIQIRGQNSLRNNQNNNGNLPLYIVDGVPFTSSMIGSTSMGNAILPSASPLNTINPNDIESIEVLKDADATAIYGSRGANGVVLITTKKAIGQGTSFDANISAGIAQVGHMMELLNSSQYITMRREALRYDNYEQYLTPQYVNTFPDLLLWDSTRYTNWQEELIGGTANVLNAQGTLSAGDRNTKFMVGGSFYRETTVFPGDFRYQRGSGLLNLNHYSLDGKFRFNLTSNYALADNRLPSVDVTEPGVLLPPVAPPLYDDAGNLNWANGTWDNPIAGLYQPYNTRTQNMLVNSSISYLVATGLTMKANLGYTAMTMDQFGSVPIRSINPNFGVTTGSSTFGSGSINTWIAEPQVEYQTKIADGELNTIVGSTLQQNTHETQTLRATGFTSDDLLANIQSAAAVTVSNSSHTVYNYAGAFARLNYAWRKKYILNLTGRRDGSSRFGPGNQFANFGAVGAAWIFSEEPFIGDHLAWLSFGKLRTSYGLTGSDQIGDYQFLNTYSSTPLPYGGVAGLVPNRLVNPDYAWETNKKSEAAIEWGLFNDRVSSSVSWFHNISSNQLVGYPLARITGQASVQYNLNATVQNTGWEFLITSTNIQNSGLTWITSWNLTIPRNKLLEYPNIEASSFANTLQVGKSLYTRKLIHGTGVDPQTGLYTFEDVNGNGTTLFDTPGDLQALKEVSQQFYGGLYNSFSFMGVELGFLFQYVKQTGYNYMTTFSTSPGARYNQPALVMNRWRAPGDVTSIQRFTQLSSNGANMFSNAVSADNPIGDASFVRLKNISISWTVPALFMQKLRINTARIYMLGQNLFTLTAYEGLDPETQNSRTLPPLRIITGGIQVTF